MYSGAKSTKPSAPLSQSALSYLQSLESSSKALRQNAPAASDKPRSPPKLASSTRRPSLSHMISELRKSRNNSTFDSEDGLNDSFGKVSSFNDNDSLSSLSSQRSGERVLLDLDIEPSMDSPSVGHILPRGTPGLQVGRKSVVEIRELRNSIDQSLQPPARLEKKATPLVAVAETPTRKEDPKESYTPVRPTASAAKSPFKSAVESGSSDLESLDFEEVAPELPERILAGRRVSFKAPSNSKSTSGSSESDSSSSSSKPSSSKSSSSSSSSSSSTKKSSSSSQGSTSTTSKKSSSSKSSSDSEASKSSSSTLKENVQESDQKVTSSQNTSADEAYSDVFEEDEPETNIKEDDKKSTRRKSRNELPASEPAEQEKSAVQIAIKKSLEKEKPRPERVRKQNSIDRPEEPLKESAEDRRSRTPSSSSKLAAVQEEDEPDPNVASESKKNRRHSSGTRSRESSKTKKPAKIVEEAAVALRDPSPPERARLKKKDIEKSRSEPNVKEDSSEASSSSHHRSHSRTRRRSKSRRRSSKDRTKRRDASTEEDSELTPRVRRRTREHYFEETQRHPSADIAQRIRNVDQPGHCSDNLHLVLKDVLSTHLGLLRDFARLEWETTRQWNENLEEIRKQHNGPSTEKLTKLIEDRAKQYRQK